MQKSAKYLLVWTVLLSTNIVFAVVKFNWFDVVALGLCLPFFLYWVKEFFEDHRVNHVAIGFVEDDEGKTRAEIVDQSHSYEFKKDAPPGRDPVL